MIYQPILNCSVPTDGGVRYRLRYTTNVPPLRANGGGDRFSVPTGIRTALDDGVNPNRHSRA